MKQKDVEIMLSRLQSFQKPKINLEQYQIPTRLAAMIVWRAFQLGDIEGKTVIDLCCGTGLFAIAASILGATKVHGIDIDPDALKIAKENSSFLDVEVEWIEADARELVVSADTILMNSPFGVRGPSKDQLFLRPALNNSDVCYSIHLYQEKNVQFLRKFIEKEQKQAVEIIKAEFEIPKMYHFHKKRFHIIEIAIIRSL